MKHNLTLATVYVLISALSYAVISAIVKQFSGQISPLVIVFIQVLVAFLCCIPMVLRAKPEIKQQIIANKQIKIHMMRVISGLCTSYFLFIALKYTPLVSGVLMMNTSPLLIPFIALIFMRKKIQHRLWVPIIIGFVGVALVLHPDGKDFNWATLIALGSGVAMASSILFMRYLTEKGNDSLTTTFFFFFFGSIVSGVVSIPFWMASTTWHVYFMVAIAGVLFFFVQLFLALSLKHAEAQFVNSMYYSNIVFAALIGILLFGDFPSWLTWIGLVLIIAGGIATIHVQHRLNKR